MTAGSLTEFYISEMYTEEYSKNNTEIYIDIENYQQNYVHYENSVKKSGLKMCIRNVYFQILNLWSEKCKINQNQNQFIFAY